MLVAYALATKKDWKCPALEVIHRVFYAIALISGVVIMNVHGVAIINIIHKLSAVLFAVVLVASEVYKAIKK